MISMIYTHYYFSNLIRWVGSRRVGAPGMTGSHETKVVPGALTKELFEKVNFDNNKSMKN